jgi:uncharacterized protein YbcI
VILLTEAMVDRSQVPVLSRHLVEWGGSSMVLSGVLLIKVTVDKLRVPVPLEYLVEWGGKSTVLLAIKVTADSAFSGDLVEWDGKHAAIEVMVGSALSEVLSVIKVTGSLHSALSGDLVEWRRMSVVIRSSRVLLIKAMVDGLQVPVRHHIGKKMLALIIPLNGREHVIIIVYHILVGQYHHASLAMPR